ncbi:MAG: lysylphosphatidylglycerol synthase transmembrane domain-containing protein [Thermoplasmatota archaeon]
MRKTWRYLFNAAVSIVLIALVVYLTGVDRITGQLAGMALPVFALAVALEQLGVALSAKKWQLLLKAKQEQVSFLRAWKYYYIGAFFNAFLPTSVGGDVVKAHVFSKQLRRREEAYASVVMDRLTGLVAIVAIGSLALLVGWPLVDSTARLLALPILVLPLALLVVLFSTDWIDRLLHLSFLQRFERVQCFVSDVYRAIRAYRLRRYLLLPVMALSVCYHLLLILVNVTLAWALGLDIALSYFFVFIPVAEILVFLPVTVQGFGVREGTYVTLFSSAGVGSAAAFSLGFSDQLVKLAGNVVGGLVYLGHNLRATTSP